MPEAEAESTSQEAFVPPVAPATSTLSDAFALRRPVLDLSHVDSRNRPFLIWSESPGASYYVVQEARGEDFSGAREFKVRGSETRWHPHWARWTVLVPGQGVWRWERGERLEP